MPLTPLIIITVGLLTAGVVFIIFSPLYSPFLSGFSVYRARRYSQLWGTGVGTLFLYFLLQGMAMTGTCAAATAILPWLFWAVSRSSQLQKRKIRQTRIKKEIPLLLDYLVLQIEAGHSLQQALRTARPLFSENSPLNQGLREFGEHMKAGNPFPLAVEKLLESLDSPEAGAPFFALTLAVRHGTPIGAILREQAERMREHLILEGEQFANTLSVKILIPLLFFIFPASFLVILSPVIVALVGRIP